MWPMLPCGRHDAASVLRQVLGTTAYLSEARAVRAGGSMRRRLLGGPHGRAAALERDPVHQRQQLLGIDRLDEIMIEAGGQRLVLVLLAPIAADRDHGGLG